MQKMQIVLNLQRHRLLAGIRRTRQTLSSGSKEVDEIKLEVDETWKGFGKIAVFCVGKKCQYTVVDEVTQTAKIPAEVLRNEAVITIGIVGFKDEAVMTSTLVAYQVEKGSVVTIEDPEPSIYVEILSRYADLATRLNNIIANAGDLTNNTELIDARVGADDVVYDTLGEAVRGQVGSLSEDMNRYGFRSIVFNKENSTSSTNFKLMKYNAAVGDILWFNNISNRKVNVVATYTDESTAILINSLNVSELKFITVEKDIQYFGLYLYDYDVLPANENVIVNIFNDNTYKKIYNHKNTEDIAKNTEDIRILEKNKVTGVSGWNGSGYKKIDGYAYRRDGFEHEKQNANYSYAELIPTDTKVRISGYGWGYSYAFRLYYFYDSSGSIILESDETYDQKPVTNLEIDIPEGATKIVVNGKDTSMSKIEIYGNVTSFEACYQAMKDTEPREPIKYFKLITLGDSITMLGTGERGWIKYFIEKTNAKLIANVAMNSAVLKDYSNTVYDGDPQQSNQDNNVLGNQVQKILNNNYEDPDVIMIAIGTNGGINITEADIKQAYYGNASTLIPLSSVNRTTDAGAYRYCLETLHNKYPNAVIIWCTPIMGYESTRSAKNAMSFGKSLKIATQYSGQLCCDTMRCGINGVNEKDNENGEYLLDGLHPNVNGAKKMGYFNAAFVNQHIDMINLESE